MVRTRRQALAIYPADADASTQRVAGAPPVAPRTPPMDRSGGRVQLRAASRPRPAAERMQRGPPIAGRAGGRPMAQGRDGAARVAGAVARDSMGAHARPGRY